ncbi:MAG: GNAT family N-acetyltransferase [Phycisphaeraceae bacterium]|nr:GNAT family N-acetyltransferase [Phycisphaeraceae bacterium]
MSGFNMPVDDELSLRLVEPRFAEGLYTVIDTNRDHLRPWMPWADQSREQLQAWVQKTAEKFAAQTDIALSILCHGQVVGGSGLHGLDSPHHFAETGYWLAADAQGKGIVTRCLRVLLDYAFDERGLHRVQLHTLPDNARSQAVAQRLGFTREGVLRETVMHNDKHCSMVMFGLLASEWRQNRERNMR